MLLKPEGQGGTRADLARRTGLARSTVAQRVDALIAHSTPFRLATWANSPKTHRKQARLSSMRTIEVAVSSALLPRW
jgi:hypothetical protein